MILHDFIYEWDGKTEGTEKPVSWWPGAYHVKIVDLASDENIRYLVPIAVLLKNAKTNTSMNTSLKNYIYNFAQKISKQYDLDMEKILWVEIDDRISVTRLSPDTNFLPTTIYAISWRPIRPNELEMIKPYLDDM